MGNGWRSFAVYELDVNKNVVGEWELKDNLPTNHTQTLRHFFEVKGFGKDQLIQFGLREGLYEDISLLIMKATTQFHLPHVHLFHLMENLSTCQIM